MTVRRLGEKETSVEELEDVAKRLARDATPPDGASFPCAVRPELQFDYDHVWQNIGSTAAITPGSL